MNTYGVDGFPGQLFWSESEADRRHKCIFRKRGAVKRATSPGSFLVRSGHPFPHPTHLFVV